MRIAFDIHNELGRHLDEYIYEHELRYRLEAAGIPAWSQYPILLRHGDFETTLAADLLVAEHAVYELKSASAIAEAYRTQALSYVLLIGTHHGKLVNFGGPKVISEFVSTTLTPMDRRNITVHASRWREINDGSRRLRSIFFDLVSDWGLFLHLAIYRQAIVHFFGGASHVRQQIPLYLGQRQVGLQELDAIDPDSLLVLSAHHEIEVAEVHYRRLLRLSRRRWMQWINIHKHEVHFIILESDF